MKGIIYLSIILTPSVLFAQTIPEILPFDIFYEGKVVLQNGDTMKGLVKYNPEDRVQLTHHQRTENLSAGNVLFFEISDRTDQRRRQFYSLPYAKMNPYKTPVFFELLCEGKITLLSRETIEARTITSHGFHVSPMLMVVVNHYFILNGDGNIEAISDSPKAWYDLMGGEAGAVRNYVKKNNLDFRKKHQLMRIIGYFNSNFAL